MRRPLVGICLFFCAGVLVGSITNISSPIYYICILSLSSLSIIFRKKKALLYIFVFLAFFFIGAVTLKSYQILPPGHIKQYIGYKSEIVYLRGVVYGDPIVRRNDFIKKTSFELLVFEIKIKDQWQKTCGKILVNVYREDPVSYGQELILEGKLYRPPNFNISEKLNYRQYLERKQIWGILSVSKQGNILFTGQRHINPVKAVAYAAKHAMKQRIYAYLSGLEADVLNALILGERQNIPRDLNDIFVQTGTVHILAISGFNIGIIAFITLFFLKILRIPQRPRYILTIFILVIYTFLTGASASVVRAALMGSIILLGALLEREADIFNSLSFAALIILLFNPNQLFEIGFQLSFISVISIFSFGLKIQNFLFKYIPRNSRLAQIIIPSFSISLGVCIGVLGIIAYYFSIITPVTVIANLFVIPLVSVITALSFAFILASFALPFLGYFLAVTTKFLVAIFIKITYLFGIIPGAYFNIEAWSLTWVIIYYLIVVGVFYPKGLLRLTRITKYAKLFKS